MENPPAPLPIKPNAFGLVELLIAIGICAVLVALLLPTLQGMARKGKDTRCIQNLKNFGVGIMMYSGETGDLPPYKDWLTNKGIWRTIIAPYHPVTPRGDSCPVAVEPFSGRYDVGSFYAHYGWNVPGNDQSGFFRASTIQKPAERFQLGDTREGGWYIIPKDREKMNAPGRDNFDFRHGGVAHLLFNDGHVEARRAEQIPTRESLTSPTYRAFWLGRSE